MEGNVRVDISGESPHEKALLRMYSDLLNRFCEEYTEETTRLANISALETAVQSLGLKEEIRDKDRDKEQSNFSKVKGKVFAKIMSELKKASTERYAIAKQSFTLGLGDEDDQE